jgi:branched-chain amino acid transport system substrate-binding protein
MLRKTMAIILSLCLVISLFSGCSKADDKEKTPDGAVTDDKTGDKENDVTPAATDTPAVSGDTILIGVSASITGSAPVNGLRTEQGAQLAVDEINAAGGVLGRKLELFVADDGGAQDIAINAINLILDQEVAAQVGPNLSGLTLAIEGLMSGAGVPFLTGATSPKLVTTIDNPYLFRIRASDAIQAKLAAKFITDNLECKKIGLLTDSDDYGAGALGVAKAYLEAAGIEYESQVFNSGDIDLTSQVQKLILAEVDGVIVWAHDNETALAAQYFYNLGLDVPIVGSTSISTKQVIDLCEKEWLTNWYSVTDFTTTNPSELVQTFVTNFEAAYDASPELYAATYYSSIYILKDAIERAGSTDQEAIREALLKTDGFTSVLASYTPNAMREMVHQGIICQIVDGKAVYLETVVVED